jgi:AraC-like DNA-binding protein
MNILDDSNFCSYIFHFSWLTANCTVLHFAPLGNFMLNLEHSHSFMELLYVDSGNVRLEVKGEEFHLKSMDLFYLNANVPHIVTPESDNPVTTYNVSFLLTPRKPTEAFPQEWFEDEQLLVNTFFQNSYLMTHDLYGCQENLQQLLKSMESQRRGEAVKVTNHLSNFMMAALQAFAKLPPNPLFKKTLETELSNKAVTILNYIREHFTEDISLTSVARALHYSPRQCQRIIQEHLGISFSSFLLDLQLSYVKTLLHSSDASLEIISELAGFKSSRSLYRQFKEQEGISPQQYRQQ